MNNPASQAQFMSAEPRAARRAALACMVTLAVALGVGRFAFTPLLPLMLHGGGAFGQPPIDIQQGGWLASFNYAGYFVGALTCAALRVEPARMVRSGLVLTVLLTLAMGVTSQFWVWAAVRFIAGAVSAWTFVFASQWGLRRLAELGQPAWSGVIYTGPGVGIVGTGLLVSAAGGYGATVGWIGFGLISAVLTVAVWSAFGAPAGSGSGGGSAHRRSAPLVETRAVGERPAGESFTGAVAGAAQSTGQQSTSSFGPATRGSTAPEGVAAANSGVTTAKSFATATPDAIAANGSTAATSDAIAANGSTAATSDTIATNGSTTATDDAIAANSPANATPNAAARSGYGNATRSTVRDERSTHPADALWLVVLYGVPGFGYIITATFLPVIARHALPGSPWPDLFWPMFGAALIVGALLAARLPLHLDNRVLLAGSYVLQACGIALGIVWPTAGGFSLGSILIGVPFTAITLFAMREARRLRGDDAAGLMGYATAAYGLGQIVGPLVAAPIAAHTGLFSPALWLAAGALLLGAAGLVAVARIPRGRGRMPECGCG
ncbi:YbfB/YjiJ family MFS transporter [Paraburkholderia kirstenboschensis]|uniref:YbfB/YjiJ family MFS transporter n=1 Tax=Paraburkholderia kirstenboschensis TaxID=1245436 RepID=A0ABZ0ERX8_9BURK|nr:YbfB/YjiJ family MFS transporter [Paraburkholderia kirstenboschensis]WOD19356.1 YbfB/YjiJ family MFS transporter [Paraburkholderia kirstenboschensis]